MALAYVMDEVFERHEPPGAHPERPQRIAAIRAALERAGLADRGRRLPVRRAREHEIERVHAAAYVDELARRIPGNRGWLDADTYFSPDSWEAARCAAGAAVDVAAAVVAGEADRGLAIVRPPGHHAEADRAMGFCLVNNVAVAAAAARELGAGRVAVVDWDVHHGNGTQHMFERDPSVLYLSTHQHPFYPGTGRPEEVGIGEGAGATVNVALPRGCGDADYALAFERVILPALRRFSPDLILVSAGFDAHGSDPLAEMNVTADGFRAMAEDLCDVSDELCGGRLAAVLEGGYDLGGLGDSAAAMVEALSPQTPRAPRPPAGAGVAPAAEAAIEATVEALERIGGSGRPP